jgi:hypothetical protein
MTRVEILKQLIPMVTSYVDSSEHEGTEATTADFILATVMVLGGFAGIEDDVQAQQDINDGKVSY